MSAQHQLSKEHGDRIHVLDHKQGKAVLDRQARRYFGLSGEEFVQAWRSGELDAHPDQSTVTYVALLIPLATVPVNEH